MALSRREFLIASGLITMGSTMGISVAGTTRKPFFTRTGLPIGVQLYCFGNSAYTDLQGTLEKIAEIGYRAVELPSFLGRNASQLRTALDQAKLSCPSAHVAGRALVPSTDPVLSGDLSKVVDAAHTLGVSYVVMPIFYIPERLKLIPKAGEGVPELMARIGAEMTLDDWKFNAEFLNTKGQALKQAGVQLAYHNHNMEFMPIGGTSGYEILLKETDPELVKLEMDAGWVTAAGHDPLALLRDHPGRYRLLHVRDVKVISDKPSFAPGQEPTAVGSGSIDWKKILPAAYKAGVTCFHVEQEAAGPQQQFPSARQSFEYLNALIV
jgi:sugar phosphate isomerase/epimerase